MLAIATILYERKAELMKEILLWMAAHQMLLEAIGFGAAQGIVLVILLVTARRVRMMKKEMDKVGAQVTNYLNIVLENEEENAPDADIARIENAKKDEEENRIISTVLQEIFP